MTDAEKNFEKENGMSLDAAVKLVEKWLSEGKISEAERGRDEILKFFPDHPIAQKFEKKPAEKSGFFSQKLSASKSHFIADAKHFLTEKAEKFREMSAPAQTEIPQTRPPENDEKLLAAFSYAWFFVLIPLFLRRDSEFVQFHAFQGIVLTAFFTLFNLLILGFFQILFGPSFSFVEFLLKLLAIGIAFFAAVSAYHGKWLKLPIIFSFAEKLRKTIGK